MKKNTIGNFLVSFSQYLNNLDKKIQGAIGKLNPQQKVTLADCIIQNWKNVRPVFVLSTGRAGTLLLNNILSISSYAYPLHQPKPELIRSSKQAYEKISLAPDIFEEVFRTAREELMLEATKFKKIYIETNNRVTFFAPIILRVFPNAIFIHLVRHPGDFVRSGIRRKWYSGKHEHDIGRIRPVEGEYKRRWLKMNNIEKIGWLWNETNQFIENFKDTVSKERCLFIKAERLFTDVDVTAELFNFIRLPDINEKKVLKIIEKPINVQKKGDFAKYEHWSDSQKDQLRGVTKLAKLYEYDL
jgi:hypothetical protein